MEYIYILMLLIPVFSALLLLIRPELWKSVSCISGSAVFLLCLAAAVFPPERLERFRPQIEIRLPYPGKVNTIRRKD